MNTASGTETGRHSVERHNRWLFGSFQSLNCIDYKVFDAMKREERVREDLFSLFFGIRIHIGVLPYCITAADPPWFLVFYLSECQDNYTSSFRALFMYGQRQNCQDNYRLIIWFNYGSR